MRQVKQFYRHIFLLILTFLLLPGTLWAGSYEKGLLWSVKKAGQANSFVFGTMHSDHPTVTNLPSPVKRAFNLADSFTAEMDMDMGAMLQSQMKMMLPANQSLQNLVGQRNYKNSTRLMSAYGMPEVIVDRMKPWAIAVTLQIPKPNGGLALDLMLYQQAKQKGLKLYGLETMDEQIGLFDNLPTKQQVTMLEQSIKDHPSMPAKIDTMRRLYLNRDIGGLMRFGQKEMQRAAPEMAEHMNKKMLVERNYRMVERMQPQLSAGNAFIAVGALHLPGREGILQLLENQGYSLVAMY